MSIREALERGSDKREEIQVHGIYVDDARRLHFETLYALSRSAHNAARVPVLLQELAEEIRPDFPDVKIWELEEGDRGIISWSIAWNSRNNSSETEYTRNKVQICAYPLTGDLTVEGSEGAALLKMNSWKKDSTLLEDAMVNAYNNPKIERWHIPVMLARVVS